MADKRLNFYQTIALMGADAMKKSEAKRGEKTLQHAFVTKHMSIITEIGETVEKLYNVRKDIANYDLGKSINLKTKVKQLSDAAEAVESEYLFMFEVPMKVSMTIEDAVGENMTMLDGVATK